MSLKHFHLIFIALAVLCCLGYGAWTIWGASADVMTSVLRWSGIASLLAVPVLVTYGVRFYHKSKDIII